MRFSIVTPVLNRATTIRDCIESVAQQTADTDNLQHIIVDGGSDDGTLEVLPDYPHLEVIHEPRLGIYVAINRGLAAARNEVVGIVNSDDLLEAGAFSHVSDCFAAHQQAQVVAGCAIVERLRPQGRQFVRRVPRHGHHGQSWDLLFHGSTAINARFIRRDVLAELGFFDTTYQLSADRELLIRMRLAGIVTHADDRVLYRYLEHEGSATLNQESRYDWRMRQEHIAMAEKFLTGGRLTASLQPRFRGWIAAERARSTLGRLQARDWREAWCQGRSGLRGSPLSFLAFFFRRGLTIPAAELRRRLSSWRRANSGQVQIRRDRVSRRFSRWRRGKGRG